VAVCRGCTVHGSYSRHALLTMFSPPPPDLYDNIHIYWFVWQYKYLHIQQMHHSSIYYSVCCSVLQCVAVWFVWQYTYLHIQQMHLCIDLYDNTHIYIFNKCMTVHHINIDIFPAYGVISPRFAWQYIHIHIRMLNKLMPVNAVEPGSNHDSSGPPNIIQIDAIIQVCVAYDVLSYPPLPCAPKLIEITFPIFCCVWHPFSSVYTCHVCQDIWQHYKAYTHCNTL